MRVQGLEIRDWGLVFAVMLRGACDAQVAR